MEITISNPETGEEGTFFVAEDVLSSDKLKWLMELVRRGKKPNDDWLQPTYTSPVQ